MRSHALPAPTAAPPIYRGAPTPQPFAADPGPIFREIPEDRPPPMAPGLILHEIVEEAPPADPSLVLGEIIDDVPEMEGFEGTRIDDAPPAPYRPRSVPPPPPPKRPPPMMQALAIATCPDCAAELPDPPPAFCEACGYRLPRVKRAAVAGPGAPKGREGDMTRCRPCGAKNVSTRDRCVDCGAFLG